MSYDMHDDYDVVNCAVRFFVLGFGIWCVSAEGCVTKVGVRCKGVQSHCLINLSVLLLV